MQTTRNTMSAQGLSGSGLENEAIDTYLQRVRNYDQRQRENTATGLKTQEDSYYLTSASPAQIKALIDTNPEKAKSLGLIPSDEVKAQFTPAALKAKFPQASDAQIAQYMSSTLDENGNYRSSLYQKLTDTTLKNNKSALDDRTGQLLQQSIDASDKAYKEFSSDPYLKSTTPSSTTPTSSTTSTGTQTPAATTPVTPINVPTSLTSQGSTQTSNSQTSANAFIEAQLVKTKQMLADLNKQMKSNGYAGLPASSGVAGSWIPNSGVGTSKNTSVL
jgi:hypothetical protein